MSDGDSSQAQALAVSSDAQNVALERLNEANVTQLAHQKRENTRRAQMVNSTLREKSSRVEKEAAQLRMVRSELRKLDLSLSRNIDVLRQEIENVGRQVVSANADFDRKEREYLAARKLLAKKKQRKLLLTGHLDYIILTNERNKAKKLEELEVRLGIGGGGGADAIEGTTAEAEAEDQEQVQPTEAAADEPASLPEEKKEQGADTQKQSRGESRSSPAPTSKKSASRTSTASSAAQQTTSAPRVIVKKKAAAQHVGLGGAVTPKTNTISMQERRRRELLRRQKQQQQQATRKSSGDGFAGF